MTPIETAYFVVDTDRIADLHGPIDDAQRPPTTATTTRSAWIDPLARGEARPVGARPRGACARLDELPAQRRGDPLRPTRPPLVAVPGRLPDRADQPARRSRRSTSCGYRKAPKNAGDRSSTCRPSSTRWTGSGLEPRYGAGASRSTSSWSRWTAEAALTEAIVRRHRGRRARLVPRRPQEVRRRATRAPLSFPMPGWNSPSTSRSSTAWPRLPTPSTSSSCRHGRAALPAKDSRTAATPSRDVPAARRVPQAPRRRRPRRRVRLRPGRARL